ncbi:bifunctional copper resistance protein CopD/cytochrome c oxidase assembly protein [Microtetraspora sp. AC03309]|uniref:bifunctional copper resistance protein CopD/cytochrome c oxidase assembly protein n=1 Tax=Microtetraspora sp. AC03309 TaxID=2779376 RepID=UPI001E4AB414|nr:cytochrome c oxidase assembly protein [Microtetraspora sp. AC03309]MCC5579207.1 bifunctional copper resistance protein CopD/cytochrome c oxidase assembly protein [Microtetraspora sp. AC03309]
MTFPPARLQEHPREHPDVGPGVLTVALFAVAAFGVLGLALWFGGGTPRPAIEGLPAPDVVTMVGLPAVRLLHDVCAVATVGTLLVSLWAPAERAGRIARSAGPWALGWAASAALTEVLTLSDFLALPVSETLSSGVLPTFVFHIPQGQAFTLVGLLALVIAAGAYLPLGTGARAGLAGLGVLAVLPPAYVGHSASAADHNLAVSSLMLHIAAVTLWVGGLYGLVTRLRGPVAAVRRFSALALCCFTAAGFSGLVNAWIRVGDPTQLWQSRYGLLVLAKIAALAALGWFGWRHRRRTIVALESGGGSRPFLRLATGEIGVMAATLGLAVALSRTAPPEASGGVGHQHELLGYVLAPFTPGGLLTVIRPDPIVLVAVVGAAVAYLVRVRRLAGGWPAGRTVAWLVGSLVLLYGLAGGVAAYGPAVFSGHAAQYALVGTAGPALLALGAPLSLRLAVVSRPLSHPLTALGLYAAPYLLLYLTGCFDLAQSSLAVRLVAQAVVVVTGTLFFAVALGVDPLPRAIGVAIRVRMLLGAATLQVWIALLLFTGPPQGAEWYALLDLPWAPERAGDQRFGALLGPGISLVVIIALLALLLGRSRAARRRLADQKGG